jgi:ATP-dependent Clp protease ATP-binding subunit ClpA
MRAFLGAPELHPSAITEDKASEVLSEFGVNLEAVREQLAVIEGRTPPKGEGVTVSPRAQAVMELAGIEAQNLGTNGIYTAHILLGVLTLR